MIILKTNVPKISKDIADIIRLFYSFEKILINEKTASDKIVTHNHIENNGIWKEETEVSLRGEKKRFINEYDPPNEMDKIEYMRHLKRSAMLAMYSALKSVTGKGNPWGALTGIRPTHFYRMLEYETEGNAHDILLEKYDVSQKKIALVEDTIKFQQGIYNKECDTSVDLYIGIPFCPTRCEYCSFISFDMSAHKAPLADYSAALIKEIRWFNEWRIKYGKKLRSIYIGGGTPTAIPRNMLQKIIESLEFENGTEFTVEAGRPDTIDREMLSMLSQNGVTRISINPQSMNQATLSQMKRPHSPQDIIEAYDIAREFDFIINMDLILGLEGEEIAEVAHTLNEIEKLDIDNLTIHTLAVKRASKLKEKMNEYAFTDERIMRDMVDMAQERAYKMGMHPYYMYRQKYMSGNLENVGFAKPGTDCIYNIDIMEETHNLIALGAGAVSKRMYYEQKRHARLGNYKSISHYIDNIDSELLKKEDFFAYN